MPETPITPEVVRLLTPALERYARRLALHRDEADDLVQETWCSALQSAASFRGDAPLLVWLRRIMVRRMTDRHRKRRFVVALDEDAMAGRERSSLDLVTGARARRELRRALTRLPPAERRAVLLCDLGEMERDQAATRLAVTRGHLRVILHRAHRRLGLAMADDTPHARSCA